MKRAQPGARSLYPYYRPATLHHNDRPVDIPFEGLRPPRSRHRKAGSAVVPGRDWTFIRPHRALRHASAPATARPRTALIRRVWDRFGSRSAGVSGCGRVGRPVVHPSHYSPSAPSGRSASPAPQRTPHVRPRSRSRNASATPASSPPRFTSRCVMHPASSSGSGDQPGTSTFGGIGGPFTFVWSPD